MKKRLLAVLLAALLLLTQASALTVEQAEELLREYYIDDIPSEVLEQSTIAEMLDLLGDPYTAYYSAEEYASFLSTMEDVELVGIGIRAYYLDLGVLLSQIAPDSPAAEAGLRVGDVLIAIDGHDTRGADSSAVDGWVRGEAGTQVSLTVARDGASFEVTLTRRQVVFPTAVLEKIEDRVGWISCTSFGPSTFQHFYEIITAWDDQVDEWVIDLRDNGGGDLFAALFSAGCFAGVGSGVYLRDGDESYSACLFDPALISALGYFQRDLTQEFESGYLTMHPAHVLVNEYTASAAELFAAVIRDSGAGLVIGARTYGKGVAQTVLDQDTPGLADCFADGDALKVTVERVFALEGATFDKVGVLPHIQVEGDLADEVAALLTAPITEDEDLIYFQDLSLISRIADSMAVPVRLLQDPANADAVRQLLCALTPAANCIMRQDGKLKWITVESAARLAGVEPPETFSDCGAGLYRTAIRTLQVYGILGGDGSGAFYPEQVLDRASLCALLTKALRIPAGAESACPDVPEDSWYADYVSAALRLGLLDADDDGLFRPEDAVSQEKFAAALARTASWLSMNYHELLEPDGFLAGMLPDESELAQRYGGFAEENRAAAWLCGEDFFWRDLTETDPAAPVTRSEAAMGVYKLLRAAGVIPA